ncbi:MAG: hypothetical protein WBV69_24050, partial [Candidatus Sulfotelmatobacter sp.]
MHQKETTASRLSTTGNHFPQKFPHGLVSLLLLVPFLACFSSAQDWVRTGSGLGVEKVRLAVPDFKPANSDPQNAALLKTFNDTFWNDLD